MTCGTAAFNHRINPDNYPLRMQVICPEKACKQGPEKKKSWKCPRTALHPPTAPAWWEVPWRGTGEKERNTKLFHNQSQVLFYGNWRSSDWLPALIHEPKSEVSRDNQGTYMKQELPSGEACWGKDPHSCRGKYVHSSYKLTYIFTHKYG